MTGLKACRISEEVLRDVYASDQDMYPAPLTYERLHSWVQAYPDLSLSFEADHEDGGGYGQQDGAANVGVIVVLPLLRPQWEDLLVGKIKEVEVDAETMFPPARNLTGDEVASSDGQIEVGLHVFHIERSPSSGVALAEAGVKKGGFFEFALGEVANRVATSPWGRRWKVVGYSGKNVLHSRHGLGERIVSVWLKRSWLALAATTAGKKKCERMGFKPTGYREMFVTKARAADGERTAGDDDGMGDIEMICVYPGQIAEQDGLDSRINSASDMTVLRGSLRPFTELTIKKE